MTSLSIVVKNGLSENSRGIFNFLILLSRNGIKNEGILQCHEAELVLGPGMFNFR